MNRNRLLASWFAVLAASQFCAVTWSQENLRPAKTADSSIVSRPETLLLPHPSWTCGMADGIPGPERGTLAFVAEIKLQQIYDVGKTPYGRRQAIVVGEGTISSEKLQAAVLPGGLDFQLVLSNGVIEIEQILTLRSADGKYILLRNAGTGLSVDDVRMVFDVEAPQSGELAWLNTGKFVGRRVVDAAAKTMKLTVYEVSAVENLAGAEQATRVKKPADVPPQPWDYRRAAPDERQGEQIVTEIVTLGGSQRVGNSKRGNRNIIPITGGTLSGAISGKVLFGGADYQNFTNGPAIDARYLWETTGGDIIIVRNTGPIGQLVPTFETRVDGSHAWVNSGAYLSSNPGRGAGGLSITMYRSEQPPAKSP